MVVTAGMQPPKPEPANRPKTTTCAKLAEKQIETVSSEQAAVGHKSSSPADFVRDDAGRQAADNQAE